MAIKGGISRSSILKVNGSRAFYCREFYFPFIKNEKRAGFIAGFSPVRKIFPVVFWGRAPGGGLFPGYAPGRGAVFLLPDGARSPGALRPAVSREWTNGEDYGKIKT